MKLHKIIAAIVFIFVALCQVKAQLTPIDPIGNGDKSGWQTGGGLPPNAPQPRKVVWVHGLEGSTDSWGKYANLFQGQRQMSSVRVEYANEDVAGRNATQISQAPGIITSQLNENGVQQSASSRNIFVGHSMGGLVTREMDRALTATNQTPFFGGFVTVATPNGGAPLAQAVIDGKVDNFMGDGIRSVAAGPLLTAAPFIKIANWFGAGIEISIDKVVVDMKAAIFKKFDFATGPMLDLPSSSKFMTDLNGFTHNKKMIAIVAKEDAPSMYREISSLMGLFNSSPTDLPLNVTNDGLLNQGVRVGITIYQGIEDIYWWRKKLAIFKNPRNHYAACEVAYRRGWQWLENAPTVWNSIVSNGSGELNDGIVPESSAGALSGATATEVLGVNHQECMNHPNVTQKLGDIFDGNVGNTQSEKDFFKTQ